MGCTRRVVDVYLLMLEDTVKTCVSASKKYKF
jgi:hypothetical protein